MWCGRAPTKAGVAAQSWFRSLVATPRVQDLLIRAKDLFVAAMVANCPACLPFRNLTCACALSIARVHYGRENTMKKLGLSAVSVSAALVCAAVPLSFHWSPANAPSISVDQAEARVGRPLTATSVAGVSRRVQRRAYRRAATGAAVGVAATGAYVGAPAPAPYYGPAVGYGPGPAPAPHYGPVAAGYGPGPGGAIVVNPVTGRSCTTEPSGFQWCWTPERR
jgi:hypothetical protein